MPGSLGQGIIEGDSQGHRSQIVVRAGTTDQASTGSLPERFRIDGELQLRPSVDENPVDRHADTAMPPQHPECRIGGQDRCVLFAGYKIEGVPEQRLIPGDLHADRLFLAEEEPKA